MIDVCIIGFGNPLRSDDGIGWLAARALRAAWPAEAVRVEAAQQLLPEMADWIAEAGFVIFIDACWDSIPGRIRSHTVFPADVKTMSMTHHFSPQGLLADAARLYHHCPEAIVVSVGGDTFDYGEGLSKNASAVFPAVLTHVKKLVQKRLMKTDEKKVENHA